MSALLLPRSGMMPRVPPAPRNLIASRTDLDWDEVDRQLEEIPDIIPDPTGWTIEILQLKPSAVTRGGIALPESHLDKLQAAMDIGIVLELGPEAYSDRKKFQAGPWCKKYDVVGWDRYAGSARSYGDATLLFLNDDQLRCVFPRPSPPAEAANDVGIGRRLATAAGWLSQLPRLSGLLRAR